MNLPKALHSLRKELHMTQNDLATALGVSYSTVNRWEAKKNVPNRSAALRLLETASAHGASTSSLVALQKALFPAAKMSNVVTELGAADLDVIHQMLEESSNAVVVRNAATYDLIYINNRAAQLAGKSVESAVGAKCYEYMINRRTPCDVCQNNCMKDMFLEGDYSIGERHYLTRSKKIDWHGISAVIEYITEDTQLYAQQMRLQAMVDRLPCGAGVYYAYDDGHVVLDHLNDSFYAMLHTTREERSRFMGASVMDALQPDDRLRMTKSVREGLRTDRGLDADVRIINGEGVYQWVHVSGSIAYREAAMKRAMLYLTFTDVTESRVLRLRLEETRSAVAMASAAGDMMLWSYNLATKEMRQDFQEDDVLGYPKDIAHGPQQFVEMGGVHPEDTGTYLEMYREIDEGAAVSDREVRFLNSKTKKYEWMHVILRRQPYTEGEAPLAFGFCTNIDLQKEQQLRYEREVRLRQELTKDSLAYIRFNLTTGMVEEMFFKEIKSTGFQLPIPFEELGDLVLHGEVYPEDQVLLDKHLNPVQMLKNYQKGKTTETFNYRHYTKDGSLRWVRGTISKLKRVSSDDVIAFYTAQDIDDEVKYDMTVDSIMREEIESVILIELSSMQARIILENRDLQQELNKAFSLDDNFRKAIFKGIVPEDKQRCEEFIQTARVVEQLKTEPILQCLYRIKTPQGATKRKKVRAFYLDDTQKNIVFVRRDVTDLYEEEQRQKRMLQSALDEADRANNAKSDFLSRMSHDMRTPLNAIIGYSDSVMRRGATEAQKDEFLNDISASGKYLLGIINDVLDMSKIESDKMTLHPEPYSIEEFEQTIRTVVEPLCKKKNITFIMDFPPIFEKKRLLDKVRFNQIFINLLSNAVKFTPQGGEVRFIMKQEPLKNGQKQAHFEVRDTGCGMSPEFLPKAFDSFSQEYNAKSGNKEQGTGLGLSIVKKLVELMGGTIAVDSTLGKGSIFTVDLAMTPAGADDRQAMAAYVPGSIAGKHILLCEDHAMNAQITQKLLEKEQCTIDWAKNGEEGVSKFEHAAPHTYDMVLMDIRMPVLDGIEATKRLRKLSHPDAKTVPIVAMSANAFDDDIKKSLDAGMNAHLTKPIEPMKLYETIARFTV